MNTSSNRDILGTALGGAFRVSLSVKRRIFSRMGRLVSSLEFRGGEDEVYVEGEGTGGRVRLEPAVYWES